MSNIIHINMNNYNHSINLLERKTLVITGVKKIENFDERVRKEIKNQK